MRVERLGSLHPRVADRAEGAVQVGANLVVHVHRVHTEGGELMDELHRLDDHQMHVQRLADVRTDSLEDGEAKGDVGDEDAIHHVDV